MDLKRTTPRPEGMPLDPDIQEATNEATITVEPGAATQVTEAAPNNYNPPPLYYHVNVLPYQPSVSGVADRGAPPSYEEAIDPNAPPPSYESLFGRMREAHKGRKDIFDFLQNILIILLGTIGLTIFLGITIVIPICMMVVGGLYLYDCPQEEYIPIFLLVGGGFGILKQLLQLSSRIQHSREEQDENRITQTPTQKLINIFLLMWFTFGTYCVYKEHEPNYDPSLGKYCNKTVYLFAFWSVTVFYSAFIFLLAFACIFTCGSLLANIRQDLRMGGIDD
ncbi:uncharacterized protein LOC106636549 [Copidosoma floridanum]|uniref:uncharacterized protein LOC106636549 n=1 Tax=Copidosoma floridanum TaxID=29053 RepID=UPI0006C9E1BD|nr:uncharacterized protein LOC106636549 [Copidosoma floridanum]